MVLPQRYSEGVPCRSGVVPYSQRNMFNDRKNEKMVGVCNVPCPKGTQLSEIHFQIDDVCKKQFKYLNIKDTFVFVFILLVTLNLTLFRNGPFWFFLKIQI